MTTRVLGSQRVCPWTTQETVFHWSSYLQRRPSGSVEWKRIAKLMFLLQERLVKLHARDTRLNYIPAQVTFGECYYYGQWVERPLPTYKMTHATIRTKDYEALALFGGCFLYGVVAESNYDVASDCCNWEVKQPKIFTDLQIEKRFFKYWPDCCFGSIGMTPDPEMARCCSRSQNWGLF